MMESLLHVTVSASALFLCILPWRIFARDRIPPVFFRTAWILLACRMLILVPLVSPAGILCTPAISVSASEAFPLPGILPPGGSPSVALFPMGELLFLLWAAGAAVSCAWILLTHGRFMRRARKHAQSSRVIRIAGIHRPIRLTVSAAVDSPCTAGLFRPVIFFPMDPEDYGRTALACILAHESAHIRRWDTAVRILFAAVRCLHWFNPLVWLLCLLNSRDLERVCDRDALTLLGDSCRARYADTLLDLAEAQAVCSALSLAGHSMHERIVCIMKNTRFSVLLTAVAAALCLSGAAVFAAPISAPSKEPAASVLSPVVLPETTEPAAESTTDADAESWLFPLPAGSIWEITKPFGDWQLLGTTQFHDGTDIAAPEDTELLAALSGTVIAAGYDYSKGIYLTVQSGEGVQYEYRHCSRICVKVGDFVSRGDTVAVIGRTGDATGIHLHFGIRIDGSPADPMEIFTES